MIQPTETPIISVNELMVSYDMRPVLWNINLSLPRHKIIGIIGPNGAGKSTLLKALMGLVVPDHGIVQVLGGPLDRVRKRVSYIPQRESVDWDFPASVLDVVMMGRYAKLGFLQRPKKIDHDIALACLNKVGIQHLRDRQIAQLSGGQQQRLFIARALAQEAEIYLMDEPFVGIDATTESEILHLLKTMTTEGKTIVMVHHDLHAAHHYFHWCVLLNMHVIASGPPSNVLTPTLLQATYKSKHTILSKVGDLLKDQADSAST